jgi:hypothetical protein
MYNIKQTKKHYLYNCSTNKYLGFYDSFEEMLESIAYFNQYDIWSNKIINPILENFNCTFNDTESCFVYSECIERMKQYVVFDEDFRIIDIRVYSNKILNYGISRIKSTKKSKQKIYYEKSKPEFRKEPVPHTSSNYHGNYFRKPKTMQEIRNNSNPEYKNFVRAKRKHLRTTYDDIFRNNSKCWKDQSKKRKQWM